MAGLNKERYKMLYILLAISVVLTILYVIYGIITGKLNAKLYILFVLAVIGIALLIIGQAFL
jgi:hypothetical protein